MSTATLSHVHTSPLKPCASAPCANSSGNLARCSLLRRDGAPGGGLCLKACAPSSLARFIHWLTAPSLTPRASAISDCFQPRSFNSKARKRLPSRQLVAWLDSVFSIVGFVIPMSLDLYAEICNAHAAHAPHARGGSYAGSDPVGGDSRRCTHPFSQSPTSQSAARARSPLPQVPRSRACCRTRRRRQHRFALPGRRRKV